MFATGFTTRAMVSAPPFVAPTAKLHLLVVDSDAAVRSACSEIASTLGLATQSTADLAQARSLLRSHTADILLLHLPGGSSYGHELISETKLLYPQISIIAMSTNDS